MEVNTRRIRKEMKAVALGSSTDKQEAVQHGTAVFCSKPWGITWFLKCAGITLRKVKIKKTLNLKQTWQNLLN